MRPWSSKRFSAGLAIGDWISARPCSLPFQKAKNDGKGEGDSLSPAASIQFRIGPRPNVLTAAQAKNRRERYNVRGGLVRETGLEFNVIQQPHHILCNTVFVKRDIWCFCIILYITAKPFQKL